MRFVNFAEQNIDPIDKEFTEDVIEGDPRQKVWPHFVGANGQFKSGMWDSTAGVFRGPMNNQIEFCHILEGEARIETSDGTTRTVKAGDSFVMDNGLQPIWHVGAYVRKHYVILSLD
ncbi:cupin domain-containing protein [Ahrensia kielensis]|uniref:Cupin domain-containing protein n=1 Tax=Ahrensia kielensis TaxID=76980 RepID=A0ABU9TAL9_9HYPH